MASEQVRRENKSDEREIRVEKDMVPKMTSHFEALVVKERGGDQEKVPQFESLVDKVGGLEFGGGGGEGKGQGEKEEGKSGSYGDKERNVNMVEEKGEEKRRGKKGEGKVESVGKFKAEGEKGEGGEERGSHKQGKEGGSGGGAKRSSRMQGNEEGGGGPMERSSNMQGKKGNMESQDHIKCRKHSTYH